MSCRIRMAVRADAADIAAIYRPAVTDAVISFELVPPGPEEMAQRMTAVLERTPWLVCECDGIAGYAYATAHRERAAYQWSVDVSAYVRRNMHRRGIGRALYASLFAVLQLQGFRNAYAGITLPNPASEGMHRAMGFTRVGVYRQVGYKAGAWHDVEWLERPLAPHIVDPPPPTPLPQLAVSGLQNALSAGLALLRV